MGDNQSRNLRYLIMQQEAVPGTMETDIVQADHVTRFRDIEITPTIEFDDENSKYANGSHAEDESIPGNQTVQITCSTKVTYGGGVTTQPFWWRPMKASGFGGIGWDTGVEVVQGSAVDGISLVRRTAYDDVTWTIWVYDTEIGSSPVTTIYKCAGCIGNPVFSCEGVGQPVMVNFTFSGKLVDIVDGAAIALDSAVQTQLAQPFLNSAFTIIGTAEKISSFQLDMGNEVSPIFNQADSTGISHYAITATRPRFSCNPLAVKQATRDWLNHTLASTTGAIVTPIGANMTLTVIDSNLLSPSVAEREGLVNWDLNFKALQNGTPGSLTDAALDLEDTVEFLNGART